MKFHYNVAFAQILEVKTSPLEVKNTDVEIGNRKSLVERALMCFMVDDVRPLQGDVCLPRA